ncbi:MAG: DMT family transporter [Hyphomonadaceae bacterium]
MPFLARALLKEKLSPASVWAAFVGFAGVAIAAYEPDMDAMSERRVLGVAMVMISVLAYALQIILLRRRAAEDGAISIGLMGNLMPAVILAAPALALAPLPALQDMGWFVLIGVVGAAFWLALTWAYARAAAQTIAPLEYTALIWATAWGWAVFQEAPKPQTYLGAAFIIGACALAAWDERRRGAPTAHIIDAEGPLP